MCKYDKPKNAFSHYIIDIFNAISNFASQLVFLPLGEKCHIFSSLKSRPIPAQESGI